MKHFYVAVLCLLMLKANAQKQVYIPANFSTDPALSTWSYERSYQSANFVCFWGPTVGTNPAAYTDANLRFNPAAVLDTLEFIYSKLISEYHFCKDDSTTKLGKYKIIIVMNDTWPTGGPTGWAFGGSYDNMIGAMWVHPNSTRDGGVLSHELTHSLQGQNGIDRNAAGGFKTEPTGSFWETHANFMRAQIYPQYIKEDMARWMATRSFQYSSTRHHYCAFNLLFAIQQADSLGMVNRLWQESLAGEHPLMAYRRLKGWSQAQFNNFMFDYARREVVADYAPKGAGDIIRAERARVRTNEPHYLWREYTILKKINDSTGRYVVPDYQAPQDYGINIIPLYSTCAERTVKVKFKGHTATNNTTGWRYGFVAVKADGKTARYSNTYSAAEAEIAFSLNADETNLYLVVSGAPTSHTSYVWEPGFTKIKRYPYEVAIQNALPEGYQPDFRGQYKSNGHVHANGGGWVSNSATVAASVYVGPNAIVRGNANITGNVRIEDNAWVESATLSGDVVISGNANIFYGTYSNTVKVKDNAILNYCTVSGNVEAKDNALQWGTTHSGNLVIGGDAEIGNCSTAGVYLQTPHFNNGRSDCDGKGAGDPSNIDINAAVVPFTDAQMAIADAVVCPPGGIIDNLALTATPTTSFVSSWESLAAINDGYTPAGSGDRSHGVYGNWNNPNSYQWVQYDWPQAYVLNKAEVFWFDDNGGIRAPDSAYLEYWSGTAWVKIGNVPTGKDVFNPLITGDISTSKVRLSMKSLTQSTGIVEFRVWGAESALPAPSYKLLSFSGARIDGANYLQWEAANEDSVLRYELEYGTDSVHFIKVATIAKNAGSYDYTHTSNSANSYYRLKQLVGNNISYSRVQKLSAVTGNLAMSADVSTSYVSPWESLSAVNDGFTPTNSNDKSHGAYGNWYSPDSIQWVEYAWAGNCVLDKAELYWFDDNGGILAPTTAYLEYWNGSAWVRFGDVGVAKDTFNTVSLGGLNTSKIRVAMKNNRESTGILEFRVFGYFALPAADKLSVLYQSQGQLTDNTLRNNLQVKNESGEAVDYKDITIRYWFTAEEFAPMTNLYTDYAQLGTGNVTMKYVQLPQPHAGALGYIEYGFTAAAGTLAANGNSGNIQTRAAKSDWTTFNKADDYSYQPNTSYLKNEKITVYQNSVLVGGKEPQPVAAVPAFKVYSKDVSASNSLSPYIKLDNTGNTAIGYSRISVRYWFTADGTANLNYYLDYAKLGNYVTGKFVKLANALPGADSYLELRFTKPDSLYALTSTGNIQHRIAKGNWSAFNTANDHSFLAGSAFAENVKVTAYVDGILVYGIEPDSAVALTPAAYARVSDESPLAVSLLQNPVAGNQVAVTITGAAGERLQLTLADAAGRIVETRTVGNAAASERQVFSVQQVTAQLLYLKVSTGKAVRTVKIIRIK
ncbi:DUF6055 domain-containing protein [uncultured Chitinophaga sp.]|uniref:DUF6055 domain-containing protein n=1 Tax=uncultured Chitinophaga sp. TaxID=339340 RepID=UPI0025EF2336|nr:DUF6055 domain-containing protein [uncultured Chitinophaga sp.]